MKDYLEAVAKCTNHNDQEIHWHCNKIQPNNMQFEEYLNHSTQLLNNVKRVIHHC